MLHHYFEQHGLGETGCILHADNCAGQNKNKSLMSYLAWHCMVGLHSSITFLVGYTRCLVDGYFGRVKQKYKYQTATRCPTLLKLFPHQPREMKLKFLLELMGKPFGIGGNGMLFLQNGSILFQGFEAYTVSGLVHNILVWSL